MINYLENITDFDIQALIDNELSWEEEKKVREAIRYNSSHLKKYNQLLQQKKLLHIWWKQKKS